MQEQSFDRNKRVKISTTFLSDINSQIVNERYEIIKEIGKGDNSIVYLAIDDEERQKYAIKFYPYEAIQSACGFRHKEIRKRTSKLMLDYLQPYQKKQIYLKSSKQNGRSSTAKILVSEQSMQKKQNFVISYKHSFQDFRMKVLVLQYFPNGSLDQRVQKGHLNKQIDAILVIKQIIQGYYCLRKKECPLICVEPEDVMSGYGKYKIIDIGLMKIFQLFPIESNIISQNCYTLNFMAPELIANQNSYTNKAFVWNIGMLMHYILFKSIPYRSKLPVNYGKTWDQIIKQQNTPISQSLKQFLLKCLQIDPAKRINWNEMISDSIFKNEKMNIPTQIMPDLDISNLKLQEIQYSLSEEKKKLQQIVEQPYKIEGKELKLSKIKQNIQTKNYSQLFRTQSQKEFYLIKQQYFQYIKIRWIYYQIYRVLFLGKTNQKPIFADHNDKQVLSFKYLLICRCFLNLSHTNMTLKKLQPKNNLIAFLQKHYNFLNLKIKQEFDKTCDQLANLQRKWGNILKTWMKQKVSTDSQRKYFQGMQNVDFQKQEQIKFTYTYYQKSILEKISKFKNKQEVKKICTQMKNYIKINGLTIEELDKNKVSFDEYLLKLIQTESNNEKLDIEVPSKISKIYSNSSIYVQYYPEQE